VLADRSHGNGTYRLAGVSVHRNLAAANGVVVRVRSGTRVAVEKSRADRNDSLVVILGNVGSFSRPIRLADRFKTHVIVTASATACQK
jgi:hypothetical protein